MDINLKEIVTHNPQVDYVYFNENEEHQFFPANGYDNKVSREDILKMKSKAIKNDKSSKVNDNDLLDFEIEKENHEKDKSAFEIEKENHEKYKSAFEIEKENHAVSVLDFEQEKEKLTEEIAELKAKIEGLESQSKEKKIK
jgi:hypothetical protein